MTHISRKLWAERQRQLSEKRFLDLVKLRKKKLKEKEVE